jgi:tetratricopeptide (TPR) repeat protein
MRTALVAMLCLGIMSGPAALAQPAPREEAIHELAQPDLRTRLHGIARLGEVGVMADVTPLLGSLRDPDPDAREEAEQSIWRIWSRSGDREIDALYETGVEQMSSGDPMEAIATFTRIIERKPEFAEGWNKRATLYFIVGDFRKSLADCDEVIKRNPNHFGALAGYAQIYSRLEAYDRALDYARRALALNPNLDGIRMMVRMLEQVTEQRRNRMI